MIKKACVLVCQFIDTATGARSAFFAGTLDEILDVIKRNYALHEGCDGLAPESHGVLVLLETDETQDDYEISRFPHMTVRNFYYYWTAEISLRSEANG